MSPTVPGSCPMPPDANFMGALTPGPAFYIGFVKSNVSIHFLQGVSVRHSGVSGFKQTTS